MFEINNSRLYDLISDSLYEIQDLESLEKIYPILESDAEFKELDSRNHQMYKRGIKYYMQFARGDDFKQLGKRATVLDEPTRVPQSVMIDREKRWKRSEIIKRQSLIMADYLCENNSGHTSFIANNTDHAYMEGHHLIPMKWQGSFNTSLDVYANIVCLCPTCHRLLHFGRDCDKIPALDKLYHERSERLANSGIKLSRDEFMAFSL